MKSVNFAPAMRCKNCKHVGASPIAPDMRIEMVSMCGALSAVEVTVRASKLCATCLSPLGTHQFPMFLYPYSQHFCDAEDMFPSLEYSDMRFVGVRYMAKETEEGFARPNWKRARSIYKVSARVRATCESCRRSFDVQAEHRFQAMRFKPIGAT